MKRIIGQQMSGGGSAGYHFVNDTPEVTLKRTGPFSGSSGAHMLKKTVNLDKFNGEVRGWGQKVSKQLKQETSKFSKGKTKIRVYKSGIHSGKRESKLTRSIRVKFKKERGGEQIETISFGLERHGVFKQKGVGSGYVASGGSVARIAKSESGKYRFKDNWFNSTLDKNIKSLSNIIVKHTGDAIVLNTKRIFIQ
ncbi:MAG: hypothetical protein HQ522_06850 [Bacteroidetes bacterium]|nr:hypothetical protein [Bacteroidota bacterium]